MTKSQAQSGQCHTLPFMGITCTVFNARVHRTTHVRPVDRLSEENLQPLPQAFAWERFATEERKVTWDGYVSYDGVL